VRALAVVFTALHVAFVACLLTTLASRHDPTGIAPFVWYLLAFAHVILVAPVAPGRVRPRTHLDRAPRWVPWTLGLVALGGAGVLAAVISGAPLPASATGQALGVVLSAYAVLMGWYGDFDEVR